VLVERVDIIESVKGNATLIGHPITVFAIQHWESIIHAKRILNQDNIYKYYTEFVSKDKALADAYKRIYEDLTSKRVKTAEQCLKNLTKALWQGIQERSISKETALELKIRELGIKNKNTFLYKAWELLSPRKVKSTDTADERIKKIEACLRKIDPSLIIKRGKDGKVKPEVNPDGDLSISTRISINKVIDFLKTDGRKFVEIKETDKRISETGRPKWSVFRNAFAAWFLNKDQITIQQYQEKAKQQGQLDSTYWKPSLHNDRINVYQLFNSICSSPLVRIGKLRSIHVDDIDEE
jgi:hypothetical protein